MSSYATYDFTTEIRYGNDVVDEKTMDAIITQHDDGIFGGKVGENVPRNVYLRAVALKILEKYPLMKEPWIKKAVEDGRVMLYPPPSSSSSSSSPLIPNGLQTDTPFFMLLLALSPPKY